MQNHKATFRFNGVTYDRTKFVPVVNDGKIIGIADADAANRFGQVAAIHCTKGAIPARPQTLRRPTGYKWRTRPGITARKKLRHYRKVARGVAL